MENLSRCHAMREIYMMVVPNLKIARDKCPPLTWTPDKTEFKGGDMVLLKNHSQTSTFDTKYKPRFRICKQIFEKAVYV